MQSFKTYIEESYIKATKLYLRRKSRDIATLVKNPHMSSADKIKYTAFKAAEMSKTADELTSHPMNITGIGSGIGYTAAAILGKPALEIKRIKDRMTK